MGLRPTHRLRPSLPPCNTLRQRLHHAERESQPWGIYTAPGVLAYKVNGNKLNTLLTLSAGTYNSVVQEWDNCGGSSTAPVVIHVGGGGPTGKSGQFSNLQQMSG